MKKIKPDSMRPYFQLLVTYVGSDWPRAVMLGVLLMASIGLQLASPLLIGHFIDSAIDGASTGALVRIAVLVLAVAIAGQAVNLFEVLVAENLGMIATNRLRGSLATHLLRLDHRFHNEHTSGELIERVDRDVDALGNFFSRFVVYLVGNALLLICTIIYLATVYWWLGIAAAALCAIVLAAVVRVRNVAVPAWVSASKSSADLYGDVEERLGGAEDLRSSGAIGHSLAVLKGLGDRLLQRHRHAQVLSSFMGSISRILFTLGTAGLFIAIIYLVQADALTLGGAYVLYRLADMLMRPVEEINRQAQSFQQATSSIHRVAELLDEPVTIRDGERSTRPALGSAVHFDSVTFGYNPEHPVLRDFSVTIPGGSVLGVVGRTGSGKSTLTRLLFRFYDTQEGVIRIGGVDHREFTVATLRSAIGFVTQDVELFRASVRDNLTMFDPAVSDEAIMTVLGELGLHEWIRELPEGLDTPMAGKAELSAGQAQLIALVRVFLADPSIVVLDEASSLLDPSTERMLDGALKRLMKGRTVIVIAHHLRTLDNADDILVLEDGAIVEHQPRAVLTADPRSRFNAMRRAGSMEVTG